MIEIVDKMFQRPWNVATRAFEIRLGIVVVGADVGAGGHDLVLTRLREVPVLDSPPGAKSLGAAQDPGRLSEDTAAPGAGQRRQADARPAALEPTTELRGLRDSTAAAAAATAAVAALDQPRERARSRAARFTIESIQQCDIGGQCRRDDFF